MIYCNHTFDCLITDKYYDTLMTLSPVTRAAEKFRLELMELPIHLLDDDCFVGRFGFTEPIDISNMREICYHPTSEEQCILAFPQSIGSTIDFDRGHTLADYECLLHNGLIYYDKKIDAELEKDPGDEYLLAMKQIMFAIQNLTERILQFLHEKSLTATKEEQRRLADMAELLYQVPYHPARTFREALQSIWMIHFLLPLSENAWYSISLGRFDTYLFPYYEKALQSGVTRAEIKEDLRYFYSLLNSYCDAACLLNIGPNYNDLSYLIIECQEEFALPGPIMGARISTQTDENVWRLLINEKLFAMGQPTFYSEEGCRAALHTRGICEDEIMHFANNSCMGISIPGKEINNMWGCVFNVSSALEMAVNNGHLLREGLYVANFESIDKLFEAFSKYCQINIDGCLDAYELYAKMFGVHYPNPFWTMLLDGCIAQKKDRVFSAPYHNATVECMGLVNVSDGLYAIQKLVFEEKKYTLAEIVSSVSRNFSDDPVLRQDILHCHKYGVNSDADDFAIRVAEILVKCIIAHNHDNIHYLPSMHTLDANVRYGATWGAGFDGRLSGCPFAKNAGPSDHARTGNLTSLALSAAKLPQTQLHGGQPIDILFPQNMVIEKKKPIAALIRTYLKIGGLQLQVNSVSSAILRDALAHPEKYNHLIVRIGGFSDYFNNFSYQTKLDFVRRFELEETRN